MHICKLFFTKLTLSLVLINVLHSAKNYLKFYIMLSYNLKISCLEINVFSFYGLDIKLYQIALKVKGITTTLKKLSSKF